MYEESYLLVLKICLFDIFFVDRYSMVVFVFLIDMVIQYFILFNLILNTCSI